MNRAAITLSTLLVVLSAAEGTAQTPGDGAAAGARVSVDGGTYTDVTVPELQAAVESTDFVIVNVHVPFHGDLPGTDVSIPFNEIDAHLDQLPVERDAKILLYCRSGHMSAIAAATLVEMGYTAIHNLVGGFNAWTAAGLPLAEE